MTTAPKTKDRLSRDITAALTIMTITITAIIAIVLINYPPKSDYEKCMEVPVTSRHTVEYYMNIADECERLHQ